MRKLYWYLTIYIKKYGLIFLGSTILAIVIFSLILPFVFQRVVPKKRQYIGLVGDYTLHTLPDEVKNLLSVGLTTLDKNQQVLPMLAENWTAEDGGIKYRFVLKNDIYWQDGKLLTAEDINYNFSDVKVSVLKGEIIFELPDVFAPFPSVVTEPVFRNGTQRYFLFFKRPTLIGFGDYKITDYKNQGNRLKEISIEGPKEVLVYRFYLTENDAVVGFKKGEVDVLSNLTSKRDVFDWPNVKIIEQNSQDQYLAVFMNNADPLLAKNVRRALAYGIYKGEDDERALGPINPNSWAFLDGGKSYKKDIDKAVERLLDELPAQPLNLELTTTAAFSNEAEEYKKQWEELGEEAVFKCKNNRETKDNVFCDNLKISISLKITNIPDTSNYQLLLMGQETTKDPDQYFLWHSDQSTNFTNYKNTRIDSLLEKGRKTLDTTERIAIYQEFQQFLLEDPPAIFIRYLTNFEVNRN